MLFRGWALIGRRAGRSRPVGRGEDEDKRPARPAPAPFAILNIPTRIAVRPASRYDKLIRSSIVQTGRIGDVCVRMVTVELWADRAAGS